MANCGFTRAELVALLREARYGADEAMFRCYFMRGQPDATSGAPLCAVCHHPIPSHPAGEVAVPVPSSEPARGRPVMATVVESAPRDNDDCGSERSATTQVDRAQPLQYPTALRRRGDFDVIDENVGSSCGFHVLACVFCVTLCTLIAGIVGFALHGFDAAWLILTLLGGTGSLVGVILLMLTGEIVTFDAQRDGSDERLGERMVTVTSWRYCCLLCVGRSKKSCRCSAIDKVVASGGDSESAANVALHLPKSCGGGTIRIYKVRGDAEQEAANWRAYLNGEL